jgi:dephospho-CoA kinase
LVNTDPYLINLIKSSFGENIYDKGQLNSKKLSDIVFEDKEKLKLLNSIIHPAVAKDFKLFLNSNNEDYIVKEAAIIFETKSENNYDKIILIQSPLEIRIERVINRDNISREEVMKRINNQLDENLIIDKCDYVISNENKEDLEDKVLSIHHDLIA